MEKGFYPSPILFCLMNDRFNVLINFDALFDIDMGCILYMMDKYPTSKYFKDYIIDADEYFIQYLLLHREDKNPLSVLFKDDIDSSQIYNELLTKKYDDIVTNYLKITSLATMLYYTQETKYKFAINFKQDVELEKFKSINIYDNVFSTMNETDMNNYIGLFIKYGEDLLSFDKTPIIGKFIYLLEYDFNFSDRDNKVPLDIVIPFMGNNKIKFMYPYAYMNHVFKEEVYKQNG